MIQQEEQSRGQIHRSGPSAEPGGLIVLDLFTSQSVTVGSVKVEEHVPVLLPPPSSSHQPDVWACRPEICVCACVCVCAGVCVYG